MAESACNLAKYQMAAAMNYENVSPSAIRWNILYLLSCIPLLNVLYLLSGIPLLRSFD